MSFVCSVCGEEHHGELPALAFSAPDYWFQLSDEQRLRGKLTADDCVTPDGHFFIRCTLRIPIADRDGLSLDFGVWSTLSEANYLRYAGAFLDTDQSKLGTMFGWFSNELAGDFGGALNLKCEILPQDDRQRPLVQLEPTDHPLAVAQRAGIRFSQLETLLHAGGGHAV